MYTFYQTHVSELKKVTIKQYDVQSIRIDD